MAQILHFLTTPFGFVIGLVLIVYLISLLGGVCQQNKPMPGRRRCRQCSAEHPPHAQFCRRCGAKLG